MTWLHSPTSWSSGPIVKLPERFAPPVTLSTPFAKDNSAQSEADSRLEIDAQGQVRWSNRGGAQGGGLMSACITYHVIG